MEQFNVPTREEVTSNNQAIFDKMKNAYGMVPNLYAVYAYHDNALEDYLQLQNRNTTLSPREREVINLVVSQVNQCVYCLAAHTAIAKMNGFSDEQIIEIRQGSAFFDPKVNVLAQLVKAVTLKKGKPDRELVNRFFEAGYDKADLVDVLMVIGDKTISNYLHGITQVSVDFPLAPELPS